MRIISGIYKGRPIIPSKSFKARPTTDFAKESLFNILNNTYEFDGLKILDLFAGTGSISYEFLSRGVGSVTSVEKSGKYIDFIKKTAELLEPGSSRLKAIKFDAFKYAENFELNFDIIFADPPYDLENIEELPNLIFQNPKRYKELDFILEHSSRLDFSKHPNFVNMRQYGKVNFSFFENRS